MLTHWVNSFSINSKLDFLHHMHLSLWLLNRYRVVNQHYYHRRSINSGQIAQHIPIPTSINNLCISSCQSQMQWIHQEYSDFVAQHIIVFGLAKEKTELESKLQQQAIRFELWARTWILNNCNRRSKKKSLKAKILKTNLLAQALDLAYDRDARHKEMMQKVDMLLQMQQMEPPPVDAIVTTMPCRPVRINPSPASPPTKRKNMNATPTQRHLYHLPKP